MNDTRSAEAVLSSIQPLPAPSAGAAGSLVAPEAVSAFRIQAMGLALVFGAATMFIGTFIVAIIMVPLVGWTAQKLKAKWPAYLERVPPATLSAASLRMRRLLGLAVLWVAPVLLGATVFVAPEQWLRLAGPRRGFADRVKQHQAHVAEFNREAARLSQSQQTTNQDIIDSVLMPSKAEWLRKEAASLDEEEHSARENLIFINVLRAGALGALVYLHLHANFVLAALKRVEAQQQALTSIPSDLPRRLLYLRAFSADAAPVEFAPPLKSGAVISKPVELSSEEEAFFRAIEEVGLKPLCLGRPQERFPFPGAQRIYFREEDWKPAVNALIRKCRLVLVRTAMTPHLMWELHELVAYGNPRLIVLWHSGSTEEWIGFRDLAAPIFPQSLPDDMQGLGFLRFSTDWEPHWMITASLDKTKSQYTPIATEISRMINEGQ